MTNFLKSILGIKKSPKVIKSKMQTRRLELIGLEERINPAITATLTGTVLDITTSAGEDIVSIVAAAGGVITINATNAAGAPVVVAGVGVTVGGTAGANTLTLTAPETSALTRLDLNGDKIGNQDFTITGIDSTAYNANFGVDVNMDGGAGADTLNVNGAVTLKGSGALVNTNIDAINIASAGVITAATGAVSISATAINTAGNVTTTSGAITYTGAVTLTGNVTTTSTLASGNLSIVGAVALAGFNFTANQNAGNVTGILGGVSGIGSLSLTGAVVATGAGVINITGNGELNARATTGDLTFAAGVSAPTVKATSDLGNVVFSSTVASTVGKVEVSATTPTKSISIASAVSAGAGSNITIAGTVKATSAGASSINATAAGAITITGGIDNVSANDIGIFSVNGAITVTGDIKGGDDVTIFSSGTGNVILNGLISNQSAGGVILIYSQGGGNVTIDKAISTVGATSVISLGNSTSTGTGILTASGTLTSAGSVSLNSGASSTVILAGAVASVGDVSDNGAGKLSLGSTIITTGGNIILDNLATTLTGDVSLKTAGATKTINLLSVNGNKNLTLEATGVITLTSVGATTVLDTVTVTNSTGVTAAAFSAAKVVLTDTTGTIAFGGSTVITTSLTTAAKAYSVSFAGTSVLSGAPVFLNTGNVSFNGTTSLTTGATITGNAATTVDLAGTIVSGGAFNIGALPLTTTIADGTQLTLNSTTAASTIANFITLTGPVTAGTATLSLLGVGTLTLSADSSTGITTGDSINVINGTLNVTGKIGAASTSTVNGGTLGGTGTLGNVTFNSGTLAPGNSPGTLTTGSIALSPQTTFAVEIGTTSTASDLLIATGGTAGGVTLSNAILSVTSVAAGVKIGDSFTIVNAINTTVISGTFAGLPEGGTITGLDTLGSTVTFRISYPNNQAVQLKVVALVPGPQDAVFTNGTVVATDALKKFTAVGTDAGGGPLVTITFATGRKIQFFAYAVSFRGGVRVALGNVDGGTDTELVTGPGAGGGPQVNVYKINSTSGAVTLQSSFFAFSAPSFTGGVYVAAGDTDANGIDDVIVGAGAGGGSRVQVYSGSANGVVTTSTLNDFFAYSSAFTGGVVVAAGDRNADGDDEIITAPASGGGYNIKSFDGNGTGNSPTVVDNFFAFNDITSIGGLSLAAGFLNSGNISDLIVGTTNGGYGVIIDFATAGITTVPFAGFTGAIRAGVAEDNIGQDFAVALAGPGGGPILNTYSVISNNLVVNDSLFILDPAFQGGLFGTPTL